MRRRLAMSLSATFYKWAYCKRQSQALKTVCGLWVQNVNTQAIILSCPSTP